MFSESKEVQSQFTKYPLKRQVREDAEPEAKIVMRTLRRDQVSFPVIYDEAERKQENLILRIDWIKSNRAKLTMMKDDTDYVIDYFFILNSCWNLVRIENWSL
ncbi:hypothetical protein [Verminephrobacter aporrectodeae]|uniref:hypothetical protein n=1 Tax=Verminephrobacter aporrectodeae TaxID=1110389 RepID=UPI001110AB3B|nr:hypothetical protein [Verminephrobacter aporrectodeae]